MVKGELETSERLHLWWRKEVKEPQMEQLQVGKLEEMGEFQGGGGLQTALYAREARTIFNVWKFENIKLSLILLLL